MCSMILSKAISYSPASARSISTDASHDLRRLMRNMPQTVAVLTVRTWQTPSHPPSSQSSPASTSRSSSSQHPYHGATLSSFSSVALHPFPLVSFALRLPSRLATYIKQSASPSLSPPQKPTFVLNLLSSSQADLATAFARPLADDFTPFNVFPHAPSPEGIPIFDNAAGALSCSLVSSIPLSAAGLPALKGSAHEDRLGSELFIARVERVERGLAAADEDQPSPLLYWNHQYTQPAQAKR